MSGLKFSLGGTKRPLESKLAFGLRPAVTKTKPVAVFEDDSEDDDVGNNGYLKKQRTVISVPPPPQDPEVKKVADKLAEFVAKNGRTLEAITKEKNPGNTPFKFLFDTNSLEYRYYNAKVAEFERAATGNAGSRLAPDSGHPASTPQARRNALRPSSSSGDSTRVLGEIDEPEKVAVKKALATGDSLAAMDAFARIAAKKEEERLEKEQRVQLLNETSFDRRRVTAVFKQDGSRGHHMQDFIPPEQMAKMLAKSGDEHSKAQAKALEEANKISSDNIGHKLLSKMGWKEGEGLGAAGKGIAAPINATGQARDTSGLGASKVCDIQEGDDAFEQYRKRMMLGYKFRPNPLGNPRKQYY